MYFNTFTYLVLYNCIIGIATESSSCNDGDIQLVGGITFNQGRLEVCMNGAWGSVCDSDDIFTTDEAIVACRQLELLQGQFIYEVKWHTHRCC